MIIDPIFESGSLIRLPFYIAFGLIAEVLFTAMVDLIAPRFLSSWRLKTHESSTPSQINGYIRWDFAPFWYLFGLMLEWYSQKLVILTPAIQTILS